MQNKYKLPPDVRRTVISLVQGYNRRKKELIQKENEICSVSGGKYETIHNPEDWHKDVRVYMPSVRGTVVSVIETQAGELFKLHESFDYRCNKSIDKALEELQLDSYNKELSEKVKKTIIVSCEKGRDFSFERSGIDGISKPTFYRLRSQFLYLLAKKLEYI